MLGAEHRSFAARRKNRSQRSNLPKLGRKAKSRGRQLREKGHRRRHYPGKVVRSKEIHIIEGVLT
jgi:hypothetical protein